MNTPLSRLQHDLDLLDSLFTRWDARESVGTEIAHAIGVGSGYRFVRELMAAYRAAVAVTPSQGTETDEVERLERQVADMVKALTAREEPCDLATSIWLERELIRTLQPSENLTRFLRQAKATEHRIRHIR